MMRRFHLSNDPSLKIEFPAEIVAQHNGKPKGFWYDVDLDWLRWLEGEDYLDNPQWMRPYLYEVFIDETPCLMIRDAMQLDAFHERHSVPLIPGITSHAKNIDWPRVAEKYSGVEIAPYLWQRRLEPGFLWYYSWDCASGIVWRADALKEIRLLTRSKRATIRFYDKILR
mgnify:FL=1